MASRRRIGQMMGGIRLGDLAAQLAARRMNRDEQRMDREQEAMRWRAANQALSQVLGGVQAFADRQDALEERDYRRARDAVADAQASEVHGHRVRALEDDADRRARQAALESLATGRDLVARSAPNRQPTVEAALDGGFVDEDGIVGDFTGGVWDFAGLDEDPEAFAVRRMADEWEEELRAVGFPVEVPRAELEALARQQLDAAKANRAAEEAARMQAAEAAMDKDLERRLRESQIRRNERAGRVRGGAGGGAETLTPAQLAQNVRAELTAEEARYRSVQGEIDDLEQRRIMTEANRDLRREQKAALRQQYERQIAAKRQELAALDNNMAKMREQIAVISMGRNPYIEDYVQQQAVREQRAAEAAEAERQARARAPFVEAMRKQAEESGISVDAAKQIFAALTPTERQEFREQARALAASGLDEETAGRIVALTFVQRGRGITEF